MKNLINKKIWELIHSNKEIGEKLFLFDRIPTDSWIKDCFTDEWLQENNATHIKWLYLSSEQRLAVIGIDEDNNGIVCCDDEGYYSHLSDGLENLPYGFLLHKSFYTDEGTAESVFLEEPDFKIALDKYESWCNENGIELDKEVGFYDEQGNYHRIL